MTNPKMLLLDEPTAGVSPIVIDELFDRILEIAKMGVAILMVEQNAKLALEIANKGYVLIQGKNRYTDSGEALLSNPMFVLILGRVNHNRFCECISSAYEFSYCSSANLWKSVAIGAWV